MEVEIDGLTIDDEIGRGGFGVVYRATDAAHGRTVAVKVLTGALDDGAKRRFDRERRAMGTVSGHPNIGVVHTSGFTDDGQPFLVMEYLEGGSLEQRLSEGPLAVDEAVSITLALCEALMVAHEAGVLHLDVKPANVLFSKYGRPKLVDFGIAAIAGDDHATTTIRATPAFAAPEVFDGQRSTERSDIYGVAATAYALLEGSAPYTTTGDESALEIIRQLAIDPVPTVSRSDAPEALRRVMEQAMSKDPEDRPVSMADFADRLRSATAAPATSPAPTPHTAVSPPPPASAPVIDALAPVVGVTATSSQDRQRKLGAGLIGVAAVLLIVALAVMASRGGNDAPETDERDTTVDSTTSTVAPETTTTSQASSTTARQSTSTTVQLQTVPTVAGQLVDDAFEVITAAGLDPLFDPHCHQTVAGTSPAAGTSLAPGAPVELLFDPCIVPDFVDLQLSDAIAIIEEIDGLGIEWPNHCDTTIIGQSVPAGTVVPPFTTTVVLDLPTIC